MVEFLNKCDIENKLYANFKVSNYVAVLKDLGLT